MIRTVLAETIQTRLSDPRIEPLTSITHVEVSGDLSIANVYVSVMAPEARRKLCVEALRHARGKLRSIVGRHLHTRRTPELVFWLDDSIQRGCELVEQLDRLEAETEGLDPEQVAFGTLDDEDGEADDEPAEGEYSSEADGRVEG